MRWLGWSHPLQSCCTRWCCELKNKPSTEMKSSTANLQSRNWCWKQNGRLLTLQSFRLHETYPPYHPWEPSSTPRLMAQTVLAQWSFPKSKIFVNRNFSKRKWSEGAAHLVWGRVDGGGQQNVVKVWRECVGNFGRHVQTLVVAVRRGTFTEVSSVAALALAGERIDSVTASTPVEAPEENLEHALF